MSIDIELPEPDTIVLSDGPLGPQGPKGDKGDKGAAGPKGDKGDIGPKGNTGAMGFRGAQGDKGDKGDKGDTGIAGPTGPTGPQGNIGLTGPQGIKGDKGDTGAQGPIGNTGPTGPQGATGNTGPQGPIGPAGPQGASTLIKPTSVAGAGVTINASGTVSMAASTTASLNGVFNGTYDIYRIKARFTAPSQAFAPALGLRNAGVDSAGTAYDETIIYANTTGSASDVTYVGAAKWQLGANLAGTDYSLDLEVSAAALAAHTLIDGRLTIYAGSGAPLINIISGGHQAAAAFDGFTLSMAGAMTGIIEVLGYTK